MHALYRRSLRKALLAPLMGMLVLVPAILAIQYVVQMRSQQREYKRYSREVAIRVADLISFCYRHVAELHADLLPTVAASHRQLNAGLPADPGQVDVSNTVARALALLPQGLHCDVAVVSRDYRILNTTYRQELGLDLTQFPDAVAAFSEAAHSGEIIPEFPVVDSAGGHVRLYTHSLGPGGAYFLQLAVCHDRADNLFTEMKRRLQASAAVREADVYLFNVLQQADVAHVFNLRGSDGPSSERNDAVRIVSELARDPAKTSTAAPARSASDLDYYQQVELDPDLAGSLPFGAVVRVRLDSSLHRQAVSIHIWAIVLTALLVFGCVGIAAWSLNRTFYAPIRALSNHVQSAERIDAGSPVHATREFSLIAGQFNEHLDRIRQGETALRELYEQTEQLVQKRTGDLEAANRRLRESESELRFLSERLLSLQEEQMHRIALELHDEFGQCLAGLKLMLHSLERTLKDTDGGEVAAGPVDRCLTILDRMMRQVGSLVSILRPTILDDEGIEKAIEWLGAQFSGASPALRTCVKLPSGSVPQELRVPIFRIAQEAINNAMKHSDAKQVDVILTKANGDGIELVIEDNGCGFELNPESRAECDTAGFGLVSMRERAQFSGGTLHITTAPGKGTHIRARWGLADAQT